MGISALVPSVPVAADADVLGLRVIYSTNFIHPSTLTVCAVTSFRCHCASMALANCLAQKERGGCLAGT